MAKKLKSRNAIYLIKFNYLRTMDKIFCELCKQNNVVVGKQFFTRSQFCEAWTEIVGIERF